jgi:hypothetical protein
MHKPSTPEATVRLLQIIIMAEKVVLTALENDDDLILLSSLKEEKVLAYQKLDIYNLTNDQCRTMIRFGREDINILSNALRLPEKIIGCCK